VAVVIVDTLQAVPEHDENNNVSLGHAWTDDAMTVFASFTSDADPVAIPTNGTVATMATDVALAGATSPEVFFAVNVTHPRVEDLEITVVAGGGSPQRLLLSGTTVGYDLHSTTLRDSGTDLASGSPPYIGEFAPTGTWLGGGSLPTNGTYDLEVRDMGGRDDGGRINAFSVHFYELDP
jgi:subtilisin-like proprotein convertase family protein